MACRPWAAVHAMLRLQAMQQMLWLGAARCGAREARNGEAACVWPVVRGRQPPPRFDPGYHALRGSRPPSLASRAIGRADERSAPQNARFSVCEGQYDAEAVAPRLAHASLCLSATAVRECRRALASKATIHPRRSVRLDSGIVIDVGPRHKRGRRRSSRRPRCAGCRWPAGSATVVHSILPVRSRDGPL